MRLTIALLLCINATLFAQTRIALPTDIIQYITETEHNFLLTRKCLQMRDRLPIEKSQKDQDSQVAFLEDELHASNVFEDEDLPSHLIGQGSQVRQREEILTERVAKASSRQWSAYAGPVASFGSIDTKASQIGTGYHSIGAIAGADYAFSDDNQRSYYAGVGGAFAYRGISGDAKDNWGSLTIEKIHASGYSTVVPKWIPEFSFNAVVGYAFAWDHLHRRVGEQTATGKPVEKLFDIVLQLEYLFSKNRYSCLPKNFSIIPLLNIQYIHDSFGSYYESGAGNSDLRVKNKDPESLSSLLGARINYLFTCSNYSLRTEIDGGWQREYLGRARDIQFKAFRTTDTFSTTKAYGVECNTWLVGIDTMSTIYDVVQVEANCDLRWNSRFFDAFFYLGIGGTF